MYLPLIPIVLLAFWVEATAGFGATVVTVTLAALWWPVEQVLVVVVPVNLLLSAYMVTRYGALADRQVLVRRVLPGMGLGMMAGLLLRGALDEQATRVVFGSFVVLLSLLELRRRGARGPRLSPALGLVVTGAAGVVHGMFACGGPLLVWAIGREIEDKTRFRATLSVVWLTLGVVLVADFGRSGLLTAESLVGSAMLLPSLWLGLWAGERLHHRVSAARFGMMVYGLLLGLGLVLVGRGLWG